MQILDKAKVDGVRFLKLPGFEATWDLGAFRVSPAPTVVAQGNAPAPTTPPALSARERAGDHRIAVGLHKGKMIREVPRGELSGYCQHFIDAVAPNDMHPSLRDVIDNADFFYFGEIRWRKAN